MRLINARTLQLESFVRDDDRPAYAILSHRWIDGQEVSLEELISKSNQHKWGWQKIHFCCAKALEHDLQYAWVDTCCIDKTSSAELSEAINSMYRWYRDAYICYAYLHDVFESGPSFGESAWFTRSWTLQELLAPNVLVFYDRSFKVISTKQDRLRDLESITKVPQDVLLHPHKMYELPVVQRMSWAATRNATRVEDIAYSLFGIFDVNLPLLYGEGQRAFARLQKEIMRQCDDRSIFLWNSPGHGPCPFLAVSPNDFDPDPQQIAACAVRGGKRKEPRPYAVTNVGLRIELRMVQLTCRLWLAFTLDEEEGENDPPLCNSHYCMFLSQTRERSNVWFRVKLLDRATCTLTEAMRLAYKLFFWPQDGDSKGIRCDNHVEWYSPGHDPLDGERTDPNDTKRHGYMQLWRSYTCEPMYDATRRRHWSSIYIDMHPRNLEAGNLLHGMVLDMPLLFDIEHSANSLITYRPGRGYGWESLLDKERENQRPFALLGNFDWTWPPKSPSATWEDLDVRLSTAGSLESVWNLVMPCGLFASFPLQSGPIGALLFNPPRLGLKALIFGFNQDFSVTVIIAPEHASVDIAHIHRLAYPFRSIEWFRGAYWQPDAEKLLSSTIPGHWLIGALRLAFLKESGQELPSGVYIVNEEDRYPPMLSLTDNRWSLVVTPRKLPQSPQKYLNCTLQRCDQLVAVDRPE